jgi:hypothetical protein
VTCHKLAGTLCLGILALTACGSSPTSPSAAASGTQACSLISAADVTRVMGRLKSAPQEIDPVAGVDTCVYTLATSASGFPGMNLTVSTPAGRAKAKNGFAGMGGWADEPPNGTVPQKVSGIGDSASEFDVGTGAFELCEMTVMKGGLALSVQYLPGFPGCEQRARTLLTIALSRV